jgi:hypothetical protein
LNLKSAKRQKDHSKSFVLQNLKVMREPVPPTLGTEGPEFCVAEDKEEHAASQKTDGPGEACPGPALTKCALTNKKKTGKHHEESGKMMVELTLLFILEKLSLSHRTICRFVVHRHGHVHAIVFGVGRTCGSNVG